MKGFTLIEALIALAIIGAIAALGAGALANLNSSKALSLEVEKVLSLLTKARAFTLSAKDGNGFGVHFEERNIALFKGNSYRASDPANQVQALHGRVRVSSVSLAGGGTDVIFKKLTGATEQSGFVRLSLVNDANASSTITIEKTGITYGN